MLLVALVLARVIAESGGAMPHVDGDKVLLVKRNNVQVGDCSGPDAGPRGDGGPDDAMPDAAGPVDAGVGDAGVPPDAPDCESIDGDAVTLMVQPRFSQVQDGTRFALL